MDARFATRKVFYVSGEKPWWQDFTVWGCQGGALKRHIQTHLAVGTALPGGFYFTVAFRGFGRFLRLRVRAPWVKIESPGPWYPPHVLGFQLTWGRMSRDGWKMMGIVKFVGPFYVEYLWRPRLLLRCGRISTVTGKNANGR